MRRDMELPLKTRTLQIKKFYANNRFKLRRVGMRKIILMLGLLGLLGARPCHALPLRQTLGMFESGATTSARSAAAKRATRSASCP